MYLGKGSFKGSVVLWLNRTTWTEDQCYGRMSHVSFSMVLGEKIFQNYWLQGLCCYNLHAAVWTNIKDYTIIRETAHLTHSLNSVSHTVASRNTYYNERIDNISFLFWPIIINNLMGEDIWWPAASWWDTWGWTGECFSAMKILQWWWKYTTSSLLILLLSN